MITIRKNIFETNSSSTHSLVLNPNTKECYLYELKEMKDLFSDGIMRFSVIGRHHFGEITTFYEKVQYILGCLAGGLIMYDTELKRKEKKDPDFWQDYTDIPTDWLENNHDIKWFEECVRLALAEFGIVFKGFDFRSYRNMEPDDMYEGSELYCGGAKYKNGKKILNPLDHECMEWAPSRTKEQMFGKYPIMMVLTDPTISILYYRNG